MAEQRFPTRYVIEAVQEVMPISGDAPISTAHITAPTARNRPATIASMLARALCTSGAGR